MAAKGRAAGVLPINAAATRKDKSTAGITKSSPRTPAPRLRLIIRRLPPGLTEQEFWSALGEEWQVGKGKIDWAAFKAGKISRDPAKPSRPARGYLKVKDQSLLDELSAKVKQTSFQDSKNTTRDPCLIGPPSLEFAPYNKIASGRSRNDGRQGTIDQDQEFIDFLQSLTEPITKPVANGTDGEATQEKITTTPLVQYLKEKKANKAKEAAEKKNAKSKQQDKEKDKEKEAKEVKQPKEKVVVKSATSSPEKAKVAKASQEALKAVNKSVAQIQAKAQDSTTKPDAKATAKDGTKEPTQSAGTATSSPAKRERQNISAAARIQRDLGLAPKAPRAARASSAAVPATTSTSTSKAEPKASEKPATVEEKKSAQPSTAATPSTATAPPPTGPRATRNSTQAANPPTAPAATAAKPTPTPRTKQNPRPSAGAKSAFLKHANPSQGVTEELLREAFTTFGTMTRCEIDKKKGLGYIDFEDAEGLKKAMAASPVKVGDKGGQVTVLENQVKSKKAAAQKTTPATAAQQAVNVGKASPVASPKTAAAEPNTATTETKADEQPSTTNTLSNAQEKDTAQGRQGTDPAVTTSAPPTAPRNASKSASGGGRGGKAANAQGGRGGAGGGTRSGGRARGGHKNRAAAAAAATGSTAASPTVASATAMTASTAAPASKEAGSTSDTK